MPAERKSYRARWLIPIDGDPMERGTIEVEGGRIAAIHAAYDPRARELGNVAVVPGLVNAHTHLEFSDLPRPLLPAAPFTDWIRAVVSHRQKSTAPETSALDGFQQSAHAGTTLLGEIDTQEWSPSSFKTSGPSIVCFRELIALEESRFAEQLSVARRYLERVNNTDRFRCGLSPHAPYSVHPELFHKLVELAKEFDSPLAIHLAETEAELDLLERGSGEFVPFLNGLGLWREEMFGPSRAIVDYLEALAGLKRALVVHGNYLGDQEINFLAAHPQLTVVYCPRTHHFFGHKQHPWLRLLEQSASVALGTDSRASNPDLSLWKELVFLSKRHPDVDPKLLLELGTIRGARALGFDEVTGSLTVGKSADLAVVALDGADDANPYAALLHPAAHVVNTMCSGRWLLGLGS